MAATWERTRYPGIYKREGPRGVRYKVVWRDPDGTQRTQNYLRLQDARDAAEDVSSARRRGSYVDPRRGRVPLAEFFDHFLETADVRPTTQAKYEVLGRLYVKGEGLEKIDGLGEKHLRDITRGEVRDFLSKLGTDEGKGAPTVEAVRRLVHRVFEIAVDEGRIERNPAWRPRGSGTADRAETRFLSAEQVDATAAEVPERFRALVYFLAYTGLRIGEASALRMRNLNLGTVEREDPETGETVKVKAGTVAVVESAPEVGGRRTPGPTKNRKSRMVHMGPQLVAMLERHLERFGTPLDPDSLVFTSNGKGAPIRQGNFRKRMFQPAAERAGIEPTPSVHVLRHSAASLMAKAGYSLREAMEELGHSHATMTARYTHLFGDSLAEKAAGLDAMIGTAPVAEAEVRELRA